MKKLILAMFGLFVGTICFAALENPPKKLLVPDSAVSYLVNPPSTTYGSSIGVVYPRTEYMLRKHFEHSDWPLFEMIRVVWCTFLLFIEYYEEDFYALLLILLMVAGWRNRTFLFSYFKRR